MTHYWVDMTRSLPRLAQLATHCATATTPAVATPMPVKVGVVGMGSFGRLHALTLVGLAEAELVAVVARRQASLDDFAQEQPDVPGYLDLDTAIAESGAEAWVVATSNATHVPFTRRLLEAGKVVLLEKPMADKVEEASSLRNLVNADSSNLMVGHILLFSSASPVDPRRTKHHPKLTGFLHLFAPRR